jgi:hypothetical protein
MKKLDIIWEKLGFSLDLKDNKQDWQESHAMMPVVLEMENNLRVFYTTRHIDGKSRISYYDVSKDDPTRILYLHNHPILEIGPIGSFDDCGTVATFVIQENNKIYLYYNGYNVRNTVPWSNSIGIAVSHDGGDTFTKMYDGPVMDRSKNDPYFTITPWIIKEEGKYHMWYTSGTGWMEINNKKEPVYNIKYAYSSDGIDWERNFDVAIPQSNIEESVARAAILKIEDNLLMWFIYRGSRDFRDGKDSYRIGFAEGNINTPTKWTRNDSISGILPGPEKFDDLMQSYPFVINSAGKIFMFYNGNSFGSGGILCAELKFK